MVSDLLWSDLQDEQTEILQVQLNKFLLHNLLKVSVIFHVLQNGVYVLIVEGFWVNIIVVFFYSSLRRVEIKLFFWGFHCFSWFTLCNSTSFISLEVFSNINKLRIVFFGDLYQLWDITRLNSPWFILGREFCKTSKSCFHYGMVFLIFENGLGKFLDSGLDVWLWFTVSIRHLDEVVDNLKDRLLLLWSLYVRAVDGALKYLNEFFSGISLLKEVHEYMRVVHHFIILWTHVDD